MTALEDYALLLERRAQADAMAGFEPNWMPDFLFGFQQVLTEWAIRKGRAAIFADCGLGKSPIQLAWAENVHRKTGKPVLLLTPLAVTFQMEVEAAKFGIDAGISRDGTAVAPVTITNYEQLEKFDRHEFGGVACDESSAIKAFDGVRRALVTDFLRKMPYRLLSTATAAPNDYIELGTSSEALGYLGYMDMLSRFFTNKENTAKSRGGRWRDAGGWRFKGHADEPFWRWVVSWARAIRRPSDLGFADDGFVLPPLEYREHIVNAGVAAQDGFLPGLEIPARGLREERAEMRRSVTERCELAAELLDSVKTGIAWCQLNAEGDLLERLIPGAVQVSGSDSTNSKEEKLAAFTRGEIRVLVTKPKIGAWGLNWQHCRRMTYFVDYSYESHYQAVRRCWRFGQTEPVTVDIITTPGGSGALAGLQRKAAQADAMFTALVAHMNDATTVRRAAVYDSDVKVAPWLAR
jgi:hypothetical protein